MGRREVLHVVRALHVLDDVSPAGSSKGLNGVELAFFHARGIPTLDNGHTFAGVDLIWPDGVTREVADTLHWVRFAVNGHLIGFHSLLNSFTELIQGHVNTSTADACVCGLPRSLQQRLKGGVEAHCPGAVNDAAVDLGTKIDLHNIPFLEHRLVPAVWSEVSCAVVDGAACWKTDASLEAALLDQVAVLLLEALAHVNELDSRLDPALSPASDLPVHLGSMSDFVVEVALETLHGTKLFT
mmetsp:Transcript_11175/g.32085  ORF Transcript_11175/g.32085 Transcript_11175/m.32085 type:complete len:241 (+) Transcript_11175:642-1364(+)